MQGVSCISCRETGSPETGRKDKKVENFTHSYRINVL